MKKVVVAMDSFKGSLSTFQAENAVKDGIKKVFDDVCVTTIPIADGGEGTVESIISAVNGSLEEIEACNPLGKKIKAKYGIVQKTKTAIIEMSTLPTEIVRTYRINKGDFFVQSRIKAFLYAK